MNNRSWKKFLMDHPELQRELEDKYESKASELPEINASDHDLARVSRLALEALLLGNDPPFLFRCGSVPARIETDDGGMPFVRVLDKYRLRYLLARHIDWYNSKGPALPPMHVVSD